MISEYSLRDGATEGLKEWVEETERRRAGQLASFKAHAETGGEET